MQKTFNVWVKRGGIGFKVCSKSITDDIHSEATDYGSFVGACDVSDWFLETLRLKEGEVKSFKLTFKED